MQFESLEIERKRWGEDEGQITGILKISGDAADVHFRINEEASHAIMLSCKDAICTAAVVEAKLFTQEFDKLIK